MAAEPASRFNPIRPFIKPVRIATWNVNSIKQRLDSALAWLAERKPDIVCLQEIKCVDEAFPRAEIEAREGVSISRSQLSKALRKKSSGGGGPGTR